MVDIAVTQASGFGLANVLPCAGAGPVDDAGLDAGIELWANAPRQWLAYAPVAAPDWAEKLGETLAGTANVVDQSSAYSLFHVTGGDAQRLLQKGLPVDLAALAPGATVVGMIAHLGVIVHFAAPDDYKLACFRSFTGGLRHWLDASIAAL